MPSAHFSTNTGGRAPEDALIADLHSTVLFVRSTTVIVIASVDRREKLLYAHRSPASQTLIVENRTTVIARIRIVPMTSDTPDSSSRRITFMSWPPGGSGYDLHPSRRYIKCSR